MEAQYLSQEKYDSLKKEFDELKLQRMPELAKRIDDARQLGDLSENAEYHAAREEMAWMQSRMKEIIHILDNAHIISSETAPTDTVGLGSTIVVELNGVKRELSIVGAQEAEPLKGRISNESPLGQAFFGRKKGDKVEVTVPAGTQVYKIVEIR